MGDVDNGSVDTDGGGLAYGLAPQALVKLIEVYVNLRLFWAVCGP